MSSGVVVLMGIHAACAVLKSVNQYLQATRQHQWLRTLSISWTRARKASLARWELHVRDVYYSTLFLQRSHSQPVSQSTRLTDTRSNRRRALYGITHNMRSVLIILYT